MSFRQIQISLNRLVWFKIFIAFSFPSGYLQAIIFIVVKLSAPVFLSTCFMYCSGDLPTSFPVYCSFKDAYYNSLCLNICPINDGRLFFKVFKIKFSSFAFWKTSYFFNFSVHFIFNTFFRTLFQMILLHSLQFSLVSKFLIQKKQHS